MMTRRTSWSFFALVALAAFVGACAQDVGDIDRTQPNKLEKSWFEGEWYMLHTVVDVNATAVASFVGSQDDLERVVWDIREGELIARRVHEDIIGLDTADLGVEGQLGEFSGSAAAIFPITGHFDVQRQYSSSTLEETNVISENMSDREWYERDYFRVNWTRQQSPLMYWDSLIRMNYMSTVAIESQDSGDDVTFFVEENEDGEVVYMDIVRTFLVEPDFWECLTEYGFPLWGYDCGPEEIAVRTSLMKVTTPIEDQHIARQYTDFEMNDFGFFRTNGCYYDARRGCADSSRTAVANIHDIWRNERTADGTPRPYAERDVDPMAYYLSPVYPWDLIDEAFEIGEQYNRAFQRAAAAAQGVELTEDYPRMFYTCLNPGTTDPNVPQDILDQVYNESDRALLEQAYAVSAEGYANGECERVGETKNIGDMRYHMFNWVNEPNAPWFGYGPSAADPLTGQILSGVANFNGGYLNKYAQRVLDYVNVIEGDLTMDEIGFGEPMREYFEDLRERNQDTLYFGANLTPGNKSPDELYDYGVAQALERRAELNEDIATAERLLESDALHRVLQRPMGDLMIRSEAQVDPMRRLYGTRLEQEVTPYEMTRAVDQINMLTGGDYASIEELPDYWRERTSPVRFGTVRAINELRQEIQQDRMSQNIMMAQPFDEQIIGFAEDIYRYKEQLVARGDLDEWQIEEELWREIRGRVYTGVQSHEIGHTVGLRHNFGATTDAMNYFPQYWALRLQTFNEDCTGAGYRTFDSLGFAAETPSPELCAGGESSAERAVRDAEVMGRLRAGYLEDGTYVGSINHYEYSSVMDYHGEVNGRQGGLGMYDYAAVAYGYGEALEVFNDAPYKLEITAAYDGGSFQDVTFDRSGERVSDMTDIDTYNITGRNSEGDQPGDNVRDNPWDVWHYSSLPIMFYDEAANGVSTGASNALWYWDNYDHSNVGAMAPMYDRTLVRRDQVGEGDLVVPYYFCSDYYNEGHPRCRIFDSGADSNEIVSRMIDDYDTYYPVSYFRRERPGFGFDIWSMITREVYRTFAPPLDHFQWWLLFLSDDNLDLAWAYGDQGGYNGIIAAQNAINFVGGVMTRPSVGTYVLDDVTGQYIHYNTEMGQVPGISEERYANRLGLMDVSVADGARYPRTQYRGDLTSDDGENPYYYFLQTEVMTSLWGKLAATIAFTDGEIELIGTDSTSDNSGFYFSAFDIFPTDVGRFLAGILAEDIGRIGYCVGEDANGEQTVNPIEIFDEGQCDGIVMNPYPEDFGRRDYNTKRTLALFTAAKLQETLEFDWLEQTGIYIWGNGDQPAILDDENYAWETFTDERGLTYAARIPNSWDPNVSGADPYPAYWILQHAVDLQSQADKGECVDEGWLDINDRCSLTVTEAGNAEAFAQCLPYVDDCYDFRPDNEALYQLQSHVDMMRFIAETNSVLYGWNTLGDMWWLNEF